MRVEVRCCCHAGKLLGTVEVSRVAGLDHSWEFVAHDGERSTVTLQWGRVQFPPTLPYIALKSMDLPLDTLRRIPTWKDAK